MRLVRWVIAASLALLLSICPMPTEAEDPSQASAIQVDVAVIGGTPEGVAAAVAAARAGRKVLLIEERDRLGGLLVHGGLNSLDLNWAPDGRLLNAGLFAEWYARVEGDSFDTSTAANVFGELVGREPNIRLWLNAVAGSPVAREGRISGLPVAYQGQMFTVTAGRYIDATEDADVAATAGVAFTVGRADYTEKSSGQPVTLVFRLTGVDWQGASEYLARTGDGGNTERSMWGFNEIMYRYQGASKRLAMRGLNVGRQNDGSVLINALWIFGVDPLDRSSRSQGLAVAEAELPHVVAYIRENCPGFSGAELAGAAAELYVRESRHMSGALYQLTIDDVLENRDQPDAVAYGSYPVDLQAPEPGQRVQIAGAPLQYAIPLRSLIPRTVVNLLVASRSAGYTSLAHGSARTVPVGMAAGQAAGVAASVSLASGVSLPDLATRPALVAEVQERLKEQGVRLAPFAYPSPLSGHPFADDVRHFRRHALVAAGYRNDYQLDAIVEGPFLSEFLTAAAQAFGRPIDPVGPLPHGDLTVSRAVAAIYRAAGVREADAMKAAVRDGALAPGIRPWAPMTRGQFYRAARVVLFPEEASGGAGMGHPAAETLPGT